MTKLDRTNKNLKEELDIERRWHLQMARKCKELEKENKSLKERIELYQKDEEEYKNKIEELENEIVRLHSDAEYLWIKI